MKKYFHNTVLLLTATIILAGCTSLVNIESDPPGAELFLDGRPLGTTPHAVELTNFVGTDFNVRLELEGYITSNVRLRKEIKGGPLIGGLFFFPFFFWAYGPSDYQWYQLYEKSD